MNPEISRQNALEHERRIENDKATLQHGIYERAAKERDPEKALAKIYREMEVLMVNDIDLKPLLRDHIRKLRDEIEAKKKPN